MDDDEFGDFGGFEAAEPVGEGQAAQLQAQASPWAAFASGNAHDRPDLLCAQNRFPTYLDPSDISGAPADPENINLAAPPQIPPNADLLGGALLENAPQPNQADIAENMLDIMLNAAGAPYHQHQNQNMNGRLPDIGLGINENHLFGQPAMNGPHAPDLPVADPSIAHDVDAAEDVHPGAPDEIGGREEVVEIQQEPQEVVIEEAVQAPDVEAPAPVNRSHERLQEELESLQLRNSSLEEELQRSQSELTAQRSRLQEIEQGHSQTLEEVRRAGHDALSLVVEQYKEQTKTVIIEQQEAAKRQLLEALNEQMKAFQDLLSTQKQSHEEEREREREEMKRSMDRAMEEACKQEQDRFQVFLQEEQEKWKTNMAKALEEERAISQEKIQEDLKAEHEAAKSRFDGARVDYLNLLEEEKKTHEAALVKVGEEEVEKAKEKMSELVIEERERGKECVKVAIEAVQADMRIYVHERQQADSRIRQRHLTSLDLFLESARQQIGLLLETEKPDASQNQPASGGASGQS